jgi:hypothetical protein
MYILCKLRHIQPLLAPFQPKEARNTYGKSVSSIISLSNVKKQLKYFREILHLKMEIMDNLSLNSMLEMEIMNTFSWNSILGNRDNEQIFMKFCAGKWR